MMNLESDLLEEGSEDTGVRNSERWSNQLRQSWWDEFWGTEEKSLEKQGVVVGEWNA